MSRFQIGLLVVLGVIATVAAGVFSQGAPTAPEAAPVVDEVAAPDAEALAAEAAAAEAEAARIEAERLAAEAAAAEEETPWIVSAPLAGPELSVVRAGVGIYEDGSDEEADPREIAEAEQAPVPVGGRVIVPGRGMAVLDWAGALRGELLRASSVTVEEGTLEDRRVALNQDDGTVRYLLSMPSEEGPVGMTVVAGPVTVSSDTSHGDMADLMITHVPDPDAEAGEEGEEAVEGNGGRTWVVVVAGSAEVDFGGPVAAAGEAAGARSVRLEAGQGAAFSRGGEAPTVMPMDLVAVETWYGQMLSGYRDSIAAFAFRCVITADEVALLDNPPASSGGQIQTSALTEDSLSLASLTAGVLVNITHRTEDGLWLEVDAPELEEPAWLEADTVQCIAPVASVPIIDKAYLAPATATPSVVVVSFAGAEPEIVAGKCTMLRWDVPVGGQISVDGQLMPGKGFQSVCPDRTTTYTLRWVDTNGEPRERRVTIVVTEAPEEVALADNNSSSEGEGTGGIGGLLDPGDPDAEPTICIGPECEVVLPSPEATRTRRPRPTKAPTEPAPIAPDPTQPPAPTDPPAPTEPSGPEPTDPPAATATIGATSTVTATSPVTITATTTATTTATSTATATDDPGPTGTPEPPTETPAPAPTATLEPPTETPAPDPDTPTPEPPPTETPAALRDGAVS